MPNSTVQQPPSVIQHSPLVTKLLCSLEEMRRIVPSEDGAKKLDLGSAWVRHVFFLILEVILDSIKRSATMATEGTFNFSPEGI